MSKCNNCGWALFNHNSCYGWYCWQDGTPKNFIGEDKSKCQHWKPMPKKDNKPKVKNTCPNCASLKEDIDTLSKQVDEVSKEITIANEENVSLKQANAKLEVALNEQIDEKIKAWEQIKKLEAEVDKLRKQLHKEYAPEQCLLISGEVFAGILEDKQKQWEKLQRLTKENERLQQEIQAQHISHEQTVSDMSVKIYNLQQEVKELEAETQKLKERSKWEEVMNNKLVSLKDKPATKEDVGKTVYQINKHKGINTYILTEGEQKGSFKLSAIFNVKSNDCFTYWQRPVLISEQELNEVKDLLRQQCKKVCSLGKS